MKPIAVVAESIGRGGGIRTPDPLLPKQMRYQATLRPDLRIVSQSRRHACRPAQARNQTISKTGARKIAPRATAITNKNTQSRHFCCRGW